MQQTKKRKSRWFGLSADSKTSYSVQGNVLRVWRIGEKDQYVDLVNGTDPTFNDRVQTFSNRNRDYLEGMHHGISLRSTVEEKRRQQAAQRESKPVSADNVDDDVVMNNAGDTNNSQTEQPATSMPMDIEND